MKFKHVIYFKFDSYCFGNRYQMEFSDPDGNKLVLELEESDVIELETAFEYLAEMIREKQ